MLHGDGRQRDALLTTEFLPVMKNTVDAAMDDWLRGEARRSSRLQGVHKIDTVTHQKTFLQQNFYSNSSEVKL